MISPSNSISADWTVSRLLDPNGAGWNNQLVDAMFLPFEAQRIKGIPICVISQEDYVSWPNCRTRSYSIRSGYQLLCEARQQVHHQGLWMRELKYSGRVFDVSRCQIKLKSSFGEHAQVHFLLRWGYTKERLLIIKFVISVCWKLRMKFMQSGVVTISKQCGKPCLQQLV